MKTKQLLVLVGVLVVLGLLVLIFENPFGKSEEQKKVEDATLLFPFFNKTDVTKIEIIAAFGLTTTTLAKQNNQWLVESMDNYPADQKAVEELLDTVAEMERKRFSAHLRTRRSRQSFKSIAPASKPNLPTRVATS